MQTAHSKGPATLPRLASVLVLAACAMSSSACADPSSDAAFSEQLPSPGTIEVARPLELTDRARVPEKETGFVSAQVGEGEIFITHDGRMPAFAPGDVIGGTQGGGYLARITEAHTLDERHVALETVPASLTEFLAEGKIRVHYDAEAYSRSLDEAVEQHEIQGEEDGERIASQAQALKIDAGSPIYLLDRARTSLPASCGVPADSDTSIEVTATLSPVIDLDLEVGPKDGLDPLPELKRFRLVASGKLEVDARLSGTGTTSGHCHLDLLPPLTALSVPLPTLTFWVGPVPVILTTAVVPTAAADVELTFEAAEVAAVAHVTAELNAGVDYENGQWSTVWEPSCAATGTAAGVAPGALNASCAVNAGAELRARLYGILGPNLGVEAYARVEADSAPPYCTYDAHIDGGVRAYAEAAAGVTVGPLDLTLAELPLVQLDLVHVDGPTVSGLLGDGPECASFY